MLWSLKYSWSNPATLSESAPSAAAEELKAELLELLSSSLAPHVRRFQPFLQKYHQMMQAAKHSLSLTCSRSFFLDGTFRARDDFCTLLELLIRVWALRRWPAKRQIIFEIELSENSVKNARKTADFGIELSENFNRWPGPTLLCLHSLVHGLSESKGFSFISCREKKWIGKESESENRAIPTEFARNSRVFFFSN